MGAQGLLTFWIALILICSRPALAVMNVSFGCMLLTAGWMWWKERKSSSLPIVPTTSFSPTGKVFGGLFLVFLLFMIPSMLTHDIKVGIKAIIYTFFYRFLIFLVILRFIKERKYLYTILVVFFAMIAVESLVAFYQYYLSGYRLRGYGFTNSALVLGGLLTLAIPVALVICFDGTFPKWLRYVTGVYLVPLLAGLIGNQSRSVWILMVFSSILIGARYIKKSWKLVIPIMLLLGGIVVYAYSDPVLLKRFLSSTNTTTDVSNLGRIYVWKSSLNMIKDHFFLGVGPDQFTEIYRNIYIFPEEKQRLVNAHNNFLQVFAETGVIGIVGFVFWIFGSIFYGVRVFFKRQYSPYMLIVILSFLFFHVFFGLIEYTLVITSRMLYFWVLIAVMLQLETIKENRY